MKLKQDDITEPDWEEVFDPNCHKFEIIPVFNELSTFPMTLSSMTATSIIEYDPILPDHSKQVEVALNSEEILLKLIPNTGKKSRGGKKVSKPKSKKKDNILRLFISAKKVKKGKKSKSLEPKKEYYRVKLIRGHKRIIRDILENKKPPTKTINKLKANCANQREAYNKLFLFVRENWESLQFISSTSSGPLTDGECFFRKVYGDDYKEKVDGFRTFNNSFCDHYFSCPAVRESYELYVDYLYAGQTAKELGEKFEFICCSNYSCSCLTKKWKRLQKYSKEKLIECPKGLELSQDLKKGFFNEEEHLDDYQ
jgi:hypothetical protein